MIPDTIGERPAGGTRVWVLAVLPLALLALLILMLVRMGPAGLVQDDSVPPIERLIVERAVLGSEGIQLSVLNDGPDPVTIAQVIVDDAYWAFTASDGQTLSHLGRTKLAIPYPWVAGEAHFVKVVTSTGATFEHEIPVAVTTPRAEARHLIAFTLIGLYVGVIPVALGLMWFPLVARLGRTGLDVLLALTVGLLLFLLVDTSHEGLEAAGALPGSYQGTALFIAAAVGAYLSLESFGEWLKARRARVASEESTGAVLALLIATGIGLHNFGEGLAIGAAFALGEAALGTLLVIGFTLHNTTEGLAIVAPIAKDRPSIGQLVRLGLIGGLPTIAGAWAGGLVYSPVLAVLFLGFGAGAIAQVALQIAQQMAGNQTIASRFAGVPVMSGLAAGFLIMLVTGMLVG
ncbi:MAG: ZIP family metal transporter [Burkholderiales bacterium]